MSRELIAEPYKDKQMPRFGFTVPFLFSEKVHFSGAVGYYPPPGFNRNSPLLEKRGKLSG
jgi:hypothetical protein